MIPKSALMALAALPATQAIFLVPCWPLSTQRLDPLVYPGEVASHMHDIVGGNGFKPVMGYNDTQAADCTSCMVSKDKSNYWVPSMFHNDGTTLTPVPQHGSASMYYLNEKTRLGAGETMEPLPVGLRVLAGFPDNREDGPTMGDKAINYKCLNYKGTPSDHKGFPNIPCPDGVRAEIVFPSCWDGKNLDSEDHKSHMAYPTINVENGACPSTHPHHLVTVKMEVIFKTFNFPWTGQNPFLWSNGDQTGYGYHADMIMGWEPETLKAAIEQCTDPFGDVYKCSVFNGMLPPERQYLDPGTCKVDSFVNEDSITNTPVNKLPGCNPLSSGPLPAIKMACQDGVTLKGNWGDYAGKIGNVVSDAMGAVTSAIGGILPGGQAPSPAAGNTWGQPAAPPAASNTWGQPAAPPAPSAAPAQFYESGSGAAAAPAAAAPAEGNPHVKTEWVWVTTTTTVVGDAPADATAAPAYWGDAAKREEHVHRHAHARRNF